MCGRVTGGNLVRCHLPDCCNSARPAACDTPHGALATVARPGVTESRPSPEKAGFRRVSHPDGELLIGDNEIRVEGSTLRLLLTPELKQQIRTLDSVDAEFGKLKARMNVSRTFQILQRTHSGVVDRQRHRANAEFLTKETRRPEYAMSAQYTCTDIAIAIYEQTLLYRAAQEAYIGWWFEYTFAAIVDKAITGDWDVIIPTPSDVAELSGLAYDVILWQTSLNILATLYSANNCWD